MQTEVKEVITDTLTGKRPNMISVIIILLMIITLTVSVIVSMLASKAKDFKDDVSNSVNNMAESVNDMKKIMSEGFKENSEGHRLIYNELNNLKISNDRVDSTMTIIKGTMRKDVQEKIKQKEEMFKLLEYYKHKDLSFYQIPVRQEIIFKTEPQELVLRQEISDEIISIKHLFKNKKR